MKTFIKILYYIFFWWLELIKLIINKDKKRQQSVTYSTKPLLSDYELKIYKIINNHFANDYAIIPQVNLASIIKKQKKFPNQYQNELFRNIDIGIFDKTSYNPLLMIEINDKTHNEPNRIERDKKVKQILENANLKLITFYAKYDNKENYIIDRINEELSRI